MNIHHKINKRHTLRQKAKSKGIEGNILPYNKEGWEYAIDNDHTRVMVDSAKNHNQVYIIEK